MIIIEGYILDSTEQQPLVGLSVEAFQQDQFDDFSLTAFPAFTDDEGHFRIIPQGNLNL